MNEDFSDVIVAPASGVGRCAVAVIRLSGSGSASLAGLLSRGSENISKAILTDRKIRLTWLVDPSSGRTLDQAMVVAYEAGASFTGEESVEIFCHGGPVIVDSILNACVGSGARYAAAGEFTRRAVAAGRMDLVQAEAVALLTGSENLAAADVGLDALKGRPSVSVAKLSSALLDVLAEMEASLDFDQADDLYVDLSGVPDSLTDIAMEMDRWLKDSAIARPALFGYRVVLTGLVNAGKSTLFNALVGAERAIVHDQPGTTRDVISEQIVVAGTGCVLFDTAGLRSADDPVESEGVRRALKVAADADIVLFAVDGSREDGDLSRIKGLTDLESAGVRNIVTVFTKSDLHESPQPRRDSPSPADPFPWMAELSFAPPPVFTVSARTGSGMDELLAYISDMATRAVRSAAAVRAVVAGERQTDALRLARSHLGRAIEDLSCDAPSEVVAASVRASVEAIGEITGSHITDQVLDRIFARFCIGK